MMKPFRYAVRGFVSALKTERNVRIHTAVSFLVIAAGVVFRVTLIEWCILIFCIALVLSAEMLNTALERLCDALHPERSAAIGSVKDIAAGAVFITAAGTTVVGLIIFLPRIWSVLNG